MSQWRLVVLPQATRDLEALGASIESGAGPVVARKWIDRFEAKLLALADNPYIGAESDLLGAGRRRLVLRPYLIVYRILLPDTVRLIRVIDGRQDLPALFRTAKD